MPPVGPRDRQRQTRVPVLSQGVSQQVPTARLVSQVADAENANFSILNGLTRRAGTVIQQHVATGLLPAGNNRMHRIVRDGTERYLVIHNRTSVGGAIIRILDLSTNTWATVDQTLYGSAAQTYINASSPDDFRVRTELDYTIILNTEVVLTITSKSGVIDQATAATPTVVRTTAAHGLTTLTGALTAISVTAPTVVTCVAHGLTTGNLVYITGSDSTPNIDGEWHVRVIDVDHFEIPKIVTAAGTGAGSWTRGEPIVISGSNTVPSIDGYYHVIVTDATHFTIPVNVTTALTTGATIPPCTWSYARPDSATMPVQLVRRNTSGSSTSVNGLSAAITAVSAANPAVVTTANPHSLYTGQTVTIAATNMTVNQINGDRVVRVLSATTFSVPVDTSGGVITGTGTWTSYAYFQLDTIIWAARPSGDATTNPVPPLWASGTSKLADFREWRERMFVFGGQRITSTQTGDLFNFWIEDVGAISDSDPIDRALSSDEVTDIDYALVTQDSIILETKAGIQFVFTATGTVGLTPSSVQAIPVTRYRTLPVEPTRLDPAAYLPVNNGGFVQLIEYIYDSLEPLKQGEDVSQHVPTFVPLTSTEPSDIGTGDALAAGKIKRMDASPEQGMVFMLRQDKLSSGEVVSRYIWQYRTTYVGQNKSQAAWTRWRFYGVRGVHDFCVIGSYMYLLAHCGPNAAAGYEFYILRMALGPESAVDTFPTPTT